jgi:quercetin dioxygenase-like cupin family protein
MYVSHISKVEKELVETADKVWIQWLITDREGARNYVMRLFTVEPGGKIPEHQHPWEHEIFVLKGKGVIGTPDQEVEVSEGNFLYIEPNILHWYRNTGKTEWQFICVIPLELKE